MQTKPPLTGNFSTYVNNQNIDVMYVHKNTVLTIVFEMKGDFWYIDIHKDFVIDKVTLQNYVEDYVVKSIESEVSLDKFLLCDKYTYNRINSYIAEYYRK